MASRATDSISAPASRSVSRPAVRVDLRALLERHLGFPGFRPGQEALVRAAIEGRDALGVLPTGGGKSVCFQLPAFVLPGMIIVVSPLISLMEDQLARARASGLRAHLLNSSLDRARSRRVIRACEERRVDLLFLAPERFRVASFAVVLKRFDVSLLAIDEAHCISQWGHDFRPAYAQLGPVRSTLGVPVMALTATATPHIREEIVESLRMVDPVRVGLSFDRPNLSWCVLRGAGHGERIRMLHRMLRARASRHSSPGAAVVYASTRRCVEAVRRDLARLGHRVRGYHAGMEAHDRTRVQEAFLGGEAPIIVATNAFGMGIDQPDVRLVAHYQLPASLEAYYQEAGRAGRDGEPADCVALYARRDLAIHQRFAAATHPPDGRLRRLHRHLRTVVGEGGRGTVDLDDAARAAGKGVGLREVSEALRALARTGVLRLYRCPEPGSAPGAAAAPAAAEEVQEAATADVGLHSGSLDTGGERALHRRAERRLAAVARFARARGCRREVILRYFGEAGESHCGRCDRCAPDLFSAFRLQ